MLKSSRQYSQKTSSLSQTHKGKERCIENVQNVKLINGSAVLKVELIRRICSVYREIKKKNKTRRNDLLATEPKGILLCIL